MADFETITISSTEKGLTQGNLQGKGGCLITLANAQLRFRFDGGTPTASNGHVMDIGDNLDITGEQDMANFRAIRIDSTDGVLTVSYRGV